MKEAKGIPMWRNILNALALPYHIGKRAFIASLIFAKNSKLL